MRYWLTAAVGLSALGLFGVTGSAYAAPSAQARPATAPSGILASGGTKICLVQAPSECITSNGAGNEVTVTKSNQAVIHSIEAPGGIQLENAAGRCLEEASDQEIILVSGGCSQTDPFETWVFAVSSTRDTFQNFATNDYLGTFGDGNNLDVFGDSQQSGFFIGWQA